MTFGSARFPLAVEYKPHHFCICTVPNLVPHPLLGDRPERDQDLPSAPKMHEFLARQTRYVRRVSQIDQAKPWFEVSQAVDMTAYRHTVLYLFTPDPSDSPSS